LISKPLGLITALFNSLIPNRNSPVTRAHFMFILDLMARGWVPMGNINIACSVKLNISIGTIYLKFSSARGTVGGHKQQSRQTNIYNN
jgi:hypothetical protein